MSKKASDITYRWVKAPKPTLPMPNVSAVLGLILGLGEDVEWFWTHTDKGSYVSGYNIVKKKKQNCSKSQKKALLISNS